MTFRAWVLLQLNLVLQSRLRPKTLKDYEKRAKVLLFTRKVKLACKSLLVYFGSEEVKRTRSGFLPTIYFVERFLCISFPDICYVHSKLVSFLRKRPMSKGMK